VSALGAYLPYSQLMHSVLLKLYSPALQSRQYVRSLLLNFPTAHSIHVLSPVWVLYCPTGHNEQLDGQGAVPLLLFVAYFPIAQSMHTRPS
jgi:hypothetical protein